MRESLNALYALCYVSLLILGIANLSLLLFVDGGVLEVVVGKIIDFDSRHPIMLIPTGLGAILIGYLWYIGRLLPSGKPGFLTSALNLLLLAAGAHLAVTLIQDHLL